MWWAKDSGCAVGTSPAQSCWMQPTPKVSFATVKGYALDKETFH